MLVLVKNTSGHAFGGFASVSWTSSNSYKHAPGSFIFTLTNMHRTQPTKFSLEDEDDDQAIYDGSNYGPVLGNGNDIQIVTITTQLQDHMLDFQFHMAIKGDGIFSSNQK